MLIAYDGTGYHGFAAQDSVPTVAGDLAEAAAKVLGHTIDITCAGRTDAGVHAWGQVIHFDTDSQDLDVEALQRSLNKMLAPQIVVREAETVDREFSARYSATGRVYRYTVLNRPEADPFMARYTWHVEEPLDIRAMRLACDPLIGDHDFAAFCRKSTNPDSTTKRTVHDARWDEVEQGILRFEIRAVAFCHQMVRSLVGTMVEMGRGKKRAGEMAEILRSEDRHQAGQPAPPHGLCLWAVHF